MDSQRLEETIVFLSSELATAKEENAILSIKNLDLEVENDRLNNNVNWLNEYIENHTRNSKEVING